MEVTNKVTGVTISVDEKAAGRLGPEWQPVRPEPVKKAAEKRPSKSKK